MSKDTPARDPLDVKREREEACTCTRFFPGVRATSDDCPVHGLSLKNCPNCGAQGIPSADVYWRHCPNGRCRVGVFQEYEFLYDIGGDCE